MVDRSKAGAPKEIEFAVPDGSGARDAFFGMLK